MQAALLPTLQNDEKNHRRNPGVESLAGSSVSPSKLENSVSVIDSVGSGCARTGQYPVLLDAGKSGTSGAISFIFNHLSRYATSVYFS